MTRTIIPIALGLAVATFSLGASAQQWTPDAYVTELEQYGIDLWVSGFDYRSAPAACNMRSQAMLDRTYSPEARAMMGKTLFEALYAGRRIKVKIKNACATDSGAQFPVIYAIEVPRNSALF